MWLKLDLEEMKLALQIKDYQLSNSSNEDNRWCKVDFSFSFPDCLHYSKQDEEVMLSSEVEELESYSDYFLNNKIQESKRLELVEPDFVFEFSPSYGMVGWGENPHATPRYEMTSVIMDWKVSLWNQGLTDHYFSTTLRKDDMCILRDYLRLVMGKVDKDSDEIKEHVENGVISLL